MFSLKGHDVFVVPEPCITIGFLQTCIFFIIFVETLIIPSVVIINEAAAHFSFIALQYSSDGRYKT